MKVITLTDKEEKILLKLLDKRMKSKHAKFELKEKDLLEKDVIKHNKMMAMLSSLKEKIK